MQRRTVENAGKCRTEEKRKYIICTNEIVERIRNLKFEKKKRIEEISEITGLNETTIKRIIKRIKENEAL